MDIIISANDKVLAITQMPGLNLSKRMSEDEYIKWMERLMKVGMDNGTNFEDVEI